MLVLNAVNKSLKKREKKKKRQLLTQIVFASNVSHDSIALHYLLVSIHQVGKLW